ncbi:uncharacterized protein METZ01_LOCUS513696, partial [marine metagenome]
MNNIRIIYTLFLLSIASAALISPGNNSNLNYTHVLFEWEQESNTDSYTLYLDNNSGFNSPTIINDNSLIYIDTENIDWDTTYYWKVKPEYTDGSSGSWSSTYTFTTGLTKSSAEICSSTNSSECHGITNNSSYQPGVTIFSSFFNYFTAIMDQY